jgi:predicted exporter
MSDPFTPAELDTLSAQIDQQLRDLGSQGQDRALKGDDTQAGALGQAQRQAQRQALEQVTGEAAESFLARFRAAAYDDVCKPGGVLNTQWAKWKDVANKDVLNTFGGILVGMGLAGSALQIAAVAVAVYFLSLGLTAFCRKA